VHYASAKLLPNHVQAPSLLFRGEFLEARALSTGERDHDARFSGPGSFIKAAGRPPSLQRSRENAKAVTWYRDRVRAGENYLRNGDVMNLN
jgi:hypothetical protein